MQRILNELLIGKDNWNAKQCTSVIVSLSNEIHVFRFSFRFTYQKGNTTKNTARKISTHFFQIKILSDFAHHLKCWFCLQQISRILLRCYQVLFHSCISDVLSQVLKSANCEKYGLGRCLPLDTSKAMGHLVPLFNFTLTGNSRNDILALNSFLRNIKCSIDSRSEIHSPTNTLKNRSVWEP